MRLDFNVNCPDFKTICIDCVILIIISRGQKKPQSKYLSEKDVKTEPIAHTPSTLMNLNYNVSSELAFKKGYNFSS